MTIGKSHVIVVAVLAVIFVGGRPRDTHRIKFGEQFLLRLRRQHS